MTRLQIGEQEWLRIVTPIQGKPVTFYIDSEDRAFVPRSFVVELAGTPNNYFTRFLQTEEIVSELPMIRKPGESSHFQLVPVELAVRYWFHWLVPKKPKNGLKELLVTLAVEGLNQPIKNQIKESSKTDV